MSLVNLLLQLYIHLFTVSHLKEHNPHDLKLSLLQYPILLSYNMAETLEPIRLDLMNISQCIYATVSVL